MNRSPNDLTFLEHLEELRGRFIKTLIIVLVTSCVFYIFIDQALEFVIRPVGRLVFTSPAEAFIARLTLTIFGGFFYLCHISFFNSGVLSQLA